MDLQSISNLLSPPSADVVEYRADDIRISQLLAPSDSVDVRVAIVGFPSDEGVRLNGGRVGSAKAPEFIRKALYKLTPDSSQFAEHSGIWKRTCDLGDIQLTGDLNKDLERLGRVVKSLLEQRIFPIILGGGHETAFGHFLGYIPTESRVNILNVDAHLDVRPTISGLNHSGSSFRSALEFSRDLEVRYSVIGAQRSVNSIEHVRYAKSKNATILWQGEDWSIQDLLSGIDAEETSAMVSFDVDVVDQAFAPGVSAPCTSGMSSEAFIRIAYLAGAIGNVKSADFSEVNPSVDIDSRTSRLAALAIWSLVLGIAQRERIA